MAQLPLNQILHGDCIKVLKSLPENSVDLIFADPPSNLQLRKDLYRPNMTKVAAVDDGWDKFTGFEEYDLGRVYRRINEAYTVLRDDAKRKKYLADVLGPDRARKLRFTEADEVEVKEDQKRKMEEQLGQTVQGRKFFSAALSDVEAGRWESAERNLKMALMYEPANPRFKEQLELVEKSRPKTDPFKIR